MKKQKNNENEKDYEYTFIQFSLPKELKEKVKEKVNASHISTMSDFVREAVQDKIRRIENPEAFESKEVSEFTAKQLRAILENISDNSQKIDLLIEKTDTIMRIQNQLEKLKNLVERPELEELEERVVELLRKKGELKPKEIAEALEVEVNKAYDVVSNDKLFEMNMSTGGFRLKNE
jgi:Arc/MetJ-type ribon-helix-helix transcriptional regulator